MEEPKLKLIKPDRMYYVSYKEAVEEYKRYKITNYEFLDPHNDDIFHKMKESEMGQNLPIGWVKGTYLWMVEGEAFVGEVCIRHTLTDELLKCGGHIGYGVRYSQWNRGIGTQMLASALRYAKEILHLDKVLITCNDDNNSSARVIEKNGGVLQDKIERTRRYWITL